MTILGKTYKKYVNFWSFVVLSWSFLNHIYIVIWLVQKKITSCCRRNNNQECLKIKSWKKICQTVK